MTLSYDADAEILEAYCWERVPLALVPLDGPWRALWSPGERFEHVEKPPCPLFSRSGQKASSRKIDFERFAGLAPQMGGEILHAAEPSLLSTVKGGFTYIPESPTLPAHVRP
jgi:hypothetical protein